MLTIILIVLLVLALAGAPVFPYSRTWGWHPSSVLAVVLIILLVLWLAGVVH